MGSAIIMPGAFAIRDARADEAGALAAAVIGQALFVRYGVTADGLARDLAWAIDAGEGLIVAEVSSGDPDSPPGRKENQTAGALRGFAWFQLRGGLGLGGYLRLIATPPGEEASGIGTLLLDEVEKRIPGRHIFLLVSDFNVSARRFYERRGYVERGRLPGLLRPEIDELLLYKELRGRSR